MDRSNVLPVGADPPLPPFREAIFKVHLRRTPLAPDVSPARLAETSPEGFTGADVAAVCREAALAALQEDLEAREVSGWRWGRWSGIDGGG